MNNKQKRKEIVSNIGGEICFFLDLLKVFAPVYERTVSTSIYIQKRNKITFSYLVKLIIDSTSLPYSSRR